MDAYSIPATSGIYRIVNTINSKFYLGSSTNLLKRWNQHCNDLKRNEHHSITLQRAFNKHGFDAFIFEIIEFVLPPFLLEREQYWLDRYKPWGDKGYNIAHSTQFVRLGLPHSPETRELLRSAN